MKINKLLVPMVALSVTYNYPNSQVQATDPACIERCVQIRNIGASLCSASWVNPFVYAGCMSVVGTAFGVCLL